MALYDDYIMIFLNMTEKVLSSNSFYNFDMNRENGHRFQK